MPKGDFSHAYKEDVYAIWYTQNRPSMSALHGMIEPDENGSVPAPMTLSSWRRDMAWDTRADTADVEVSQRTDREIVNIRMKMMKRHAQMAQDVAENAYAHLMEHGFDSSTSAVTALFKAFEEEKRSRGMEVALTQVFSMSDEELQKTMNRMLSKATGLDTENTVNGEVIEDALSTEETPDD